MYQNIRLSFTRTSNICLAGFLYFLTFTGATTPGWTALEHLPDEQAMSADQKQIMNQDEARQYMLKLINRDRATLGAKPVVLDDVATKAGQMHSDEMATNGYLSHWTMDGRKPDQRYNESGGKDAVMENAFVSLEGTAAENNSATPNKLPLHPSQAFHRYELDQIESSFFNEKPPNDGHRVNIIDPLHTSVGIGLSFASQFGMGIRTACAQEFVNHYGESEDIPAKVTLGDALTLKGTLAKGVSLKCIDIRWEAMPKPMTIAELNQTHSYSMPDKVTASYFTAADQTNDPISVKKVDDQETYTLQIKTDKEWQPGIYYITYWASVNNGGDDSVVSSRIIQLTAKE
ncbi:hypothetical protein BH10CYA1_BH10CYA1_05580 [soil metagenome]